MPARHVLSGNPALIGDPSLSHGAAIDTCGLPHLLSGKERMVGGGDEAVMALARDLYSLSHLRAGSHDTPEAMFMRQNLITDLHIFNRDQAPTGCDGRSCWKAGGASDKKVNWSDMVGLNLGEIAEKGGEVLAGGPAMVVVDRHGAETMLKHGPRKLVDLADARAFPSEGLPSDRGGLNAAAN
jgi:hypothetical protein